MMRIFVLLLAVCALLGCGDESWGTGMGHTYTGTRVGSATIVITLPDDGDKIDAASVNVPLEALADLIAGMNPQGRHLNATPVALSDADHTIDVTQGSYFELTEAPALVRTITLDATTGSPAATERLEFVVRKAMATGQQYIFKRGATTIAEIWGNASGDAGAWLVFELKGGVFRLGPNCGGGASGGVLANTNS